MPSDLFRSGRVFILDGALGTELERHGIDTAQPGWTSRAILTHPDLIRQIHREYILAGADIITANTFRTNPRAHRATGLDAESLTKRAIQIAIEARERSGKHVLIAGSIAPAEDCFSPELVPDNSDEIFHEHALMTKWMTEAGADLILIETMNSLREAEIALAAVGSVSTLPVIVSVVILDRMHLLDGSLIASAVNALTDADLIAINCTPLSIAMESAEVFASLAEAAEIPFGLYPNASERRKTGEWDLIAHSDDEFVGASERFISLGASMVGSCCGTTPGTTRAIANTIRP